MYILTNECGIPCVSIIILFQLSSVPSDFNLSETDSKDDYLQEGSILYNFPWGKDAIETFRNLGDEPLQELQAETDISHRVREIVASQYSNTKSVDH